jgi:hypothetical protein
MAAGAGIGFSIYAASLADLQDFEKGATALDIDVSSPARSAQPSNLALDVSTIVDMAPYVYKALVFINALGGTLKLIDWISEKLKTRAAAERPGKPIFVLDIGGKAYPVGNGTDLQIVKSAIEASSTPATG